MGCCSVVGIFSMVGWIMDPEFSPAVARADLTVGMSLVGSQPSPWEYSIDCQDTTHTLLTYHHSLTLAEGEHVEDVVD